MLKYVEEKDRIPSIDDECKNQYHENACVYESGE